MTELGKWSGRGMTRRTFLQASAATAAVAATAGALGGHKPVLAALEEAIVGDASATGGEQVFGCVCRPDCFGYCRHDVHVRDGKVVKIGLGKLPDQRYNRISQRGLAQIPRIYDPDRVKYPMKRAGERGENKWERISWDQAISEITDTWKKIAAEHGPAANSFMFGAGNEALLNGILPGAGSRLRTLIGGSLINNCTDEAIVVGLDRVLSYAGDWSTANEPADWVNARTFFMWGYNITECNLHNWHFVADAMEKGAKVIVLGPVYTQIASKAQQWVPVRPGSDPALMLSMVNVLIGEKLYDKKFLLEHTVAPYLVRSDTKMFLRMSDLGVKPKQGPPDATGAPTVIDPVAVWDPKTGRAVADGSIAAPALSGSYKPQGIAVTTAFDMLAAEAANYAPEVAAEITEVPAATIIDLARQASGKGVMHLGGFGPQAFTNGVMVGHGLATLAVLTGNVGVSGSSAGIYWNWYEGINWAWSTPDGAVGAGPTVPSLTFRDVLNSGEFMGEAFPIKSLHVQAANPISMQVDRKSWIEEILPKLDLFVVRDLVFTDTARYADYVLPVSHWYETEDVIALGAQHPFMQYSPRAIEPLYESKSDVDITRLMADKMGVGEYFSKTDAEYLDELLDTPVSKERGVSYAALKKKGAINIYGDGGKTFIAFEGGAFLTPSGKAEFYVENPAPRIDYGQEFDADRERLLRFFPPQEAWKDNPAAKKYPLVLVSERNRFRVHSQWFGNPWLLELGPEPVIRINPDDAEKRGIADGDYVEVYNDRGHAVAKAVVTQGIKAGVLSYPKGWERHEMKAGHFQELTGTLVDPVGVNQSFFDTLAEVRKWNGEEV